MSVLLSFVLALLLTTVLLPLCIRIAAPLGLIDSPTPARKTHTGQIPRSGGLAIAAGSLVAAVYWVPFDSGLLLLFVAVLVILVFGLADDLLELDSLQKLIGQAIGAVILIGAYGAFPDLPFFALGEAPFWLATVTTFVFVVGVTNAINLSDGLDGLAAGNSLLSLGLLAVLAAQAGETNYVVMALALAGGLLGFLRFNTHPARLFMGDAGSQFLGFSAVALALLVMQQDTLPVSPVLPLLLFGLPILDTMTVVGARTLHGRPILKADRSHLHHQFLRLGFKHYEVVAIMYGLQAIIVGLAYLLRYSADVLLLAVYAGYCATVIGFIAWAKSASWRAHSNGQSLERRNLWLRKLEWYHLHTAKVLGAAAGAFLLVCGAWNAPHSAGVGDIAMISAALLGAAWLYFRDNPTFVCRLITFVAAVFIVYVSLVAASQPVFNLLADLYIAGLAAALMLAIRMTRRDLFHLDNQDYLVLFIVAAVPFLPFDEFDGIQVARVALRFAVLLYACEYVASKGQGSRLLLNVCGIGSLLLLRLVP